MRTIVTTWQIEIGSLGHWLPTSQRALLKTAPLLTKQCARKTMDEAAHKDAGASQAIFKARLEIVSEIQSLATAPKMCVGSGEFHVQCFYIYTRH